MRRALGGPATLAARGVGALLGAYVLVLALRIAATVGEGEDWTISAGAAALSATPGLLLLALAALDAEAGLSGRRGVGTRVLAGVTLALHVAIQVLLREEPNFWGPRVMGLAVVVLSASVALDRPWRRLRAREPAAATRS